MYIGQIFGVYRADFKCKKGSLIRRLYMQNAVVFDTYCTYISRILGINLIYIIEVAKKLNIWLNSTNLYIPTGLVLHQAFPNHDFSKILHWERDQQPLYTALATPEFRKLKR